MKKKLIALISSLSLLAASAQSMLSANAEDFYEYQLKGYGICSHDIVYALRNDIHIEDKEVPAGEIWYGYVMEDFIKKQDPSTKMAIAIFPENFYDEEVEEEIKRLKGLGFEAISQGSRYYIQAIATVEQMRNFPVNENYGYRIGLVKYDEKIEKEIEELLEFSEPTTEPTSEPISVVKGLSGDADNNGEISVTDTVVLQKWLLGIAELPNWKNADVCEDGVINIYDLLKLKQILIES